MGRGPKHPICQCCGQEIITSELPYLPPVKKRILDFIKKNPCSNSERIINSVWGDDPEGGPCSNIISAHICGINKILTTYNFKIKSSGGPGSVYWLEALLK